MINPIVFHILISTLCILLQNKEPENKIPFQFGERVSYSVYYNWGPIWMSAANVDFNIQSEIYHNRPVFKFISTGSSIPSYDWFFFVRDTFISYSDIYNLNSYYYFQNSWEGSVKIKNKLQFNRVSNTITARLESSKKTAVDTIFDYKPETRDLLNAVYYCRTINFDSLKINQTMPIKTVFDDSIYNLFIRYMGKEVITLKNGRKFNTVKIRAKLIAGSIFSGGEDLEIWISDDPSRVPIKVVAKILIGNVKAFINETENLKYPLSSEIRE